MRKVWERFFKEPMPKSFRNRVAALAEAELAQRKESAWSFQRIWAPATGLAFAAGIAAIVLLHRDKELPAESEDTDFNAAVLAADAELLRDAELLVDLKALETYKFLGMRKWQKKKI